MSKSTEQMDISTSVARRADPSSNPLGGLTREKVRSSRRKHWGGRTFRFSFTSFRLGTDFSVRRFSMTEATLLIMMAYMTSKGLGVIRQLIFNVLFGTGPAATAYIAAFKLPDTLFNLIAGGALSSALIPIFIVTLQDSFTTLSDSQKQTRAAGAARSQVPE